MTEHQKQYSDDEIMIQWIDMYKRMWLLIINLKISMTYLSVYEVVDFFQHVFFWITMFKRFVAWLAQMSDLNLIELFLYYLKKQYSNENQEILNDFGITARQMRKILNEKIEIIFLLNATLKLKNRNQIWIKYPF